jgi:hypothetical protein
VLDNETAQADVSASEAAELTTALVQALKETGNRIGAERLLPDSDIDEDTVLSLPLTLEDTIRCAFMADA